MFRKLMFVLPVCACVMPGCMSTPPLSEATGTEHSEIMIKDVVQRVKCELSEAFDKKVDQREFLWLASWTAHADLTLQVNDSAGVAPNGGYTKYLRANQPRQHKSHYQRNRSLRLKCQRKSQRSGGEVRDRELYDRA